jgi:hypothetical protein
MVLLVDVFDKRVIRKHGMPQNALHHGHTLRSS